MLVVGRAAGREYARVQARRTARRGAGVRGGSGGDALSAQLAAFIASLGGFWWDGRTGITLATGVSGWVDRVGGKTLSQATAANQPAYASGLLTFDGVNDLLTGATSILNGLGQGTFYLVGASTAAGVSILAEYGSAPGAPRCGMYTNVGPLDFYSYNGGVLLNDWSAGANPTPIAVFSTAFKNNDGVTAVKQPARNGVGMGGGYIGASDMTGLVLGVGDFTVGARALGGASLWSAMTARAVVVLPAQYTTGSATDTTMVTTLRAIYGV